MPAKPITPNEYIRRCILDMTQLEMAEMLGISQNRWCRYERGYRLPKWHKETIRQTAAERGLPFRESLFAVVPCEAVQEA